MKDRPNHLDPQQRSAVVREAFEAITAVGFMKWKAAERALGFEVTEEDRLLYFREYERDYFADFQRMAANVPDDRLLDVRDFWLDKAPTMGLKEWQQVLRAGEGAKPWYEALRQEIAADALLRAALDDVQGVVENGGMARTQANGTVAFIPFASLNREERLRLLTQVSIDWPSYFDRGLETTQADRIVEGAATGKPREMWFEGFDPAKRRASTEQEAFQNILDGKTTEAPAAEKGKDKGIER